MGSGAKQGKSANAPSVRNPSKSTKTRRRRRRFWALLKNSAVLGASGAMASGAMAREQLTRLETRGPGNLRKSVDPAFLKRKLLMNQFSSAAGTTCDLDIVLAADPGNPKSQQATNPADPTQWDYSQFINIGAGHEISIILGFFIFLQLFFVVPTPVFCNCFLSSIRRSSDADTGGR